jgi:starch phosphorylase
LHTRTTYWAQNVREVAYLSAEYLLGPHLGNNLVNLGLYDKIKFALEELGLNLDDLLEQEEEPGLGNGGLGRLAACFLDSLATLDLPAIGYGIRYEFGIFDQKIENGWQVEITDRWLRYGNPWEIPKIENTFQIQYGGYTQSGTDENGKYFVKWIPNKIVKAVAYDTPILGYNTNTVATLRLWKSEAYEAFDFESFNKGDYYGAVDDKIISENITKVLYPNDEQISGKQLRLEQQYLFVSASLQDIIRIHKGRGNSIETLHEKFNIQLNDTHPSIAIAELMRLLVDIHGLEWEKAWDITQKSFGYTNHTLLPEALEKWPVSLFGGLLPRHLEIILEINYRFLEEVKAKYPGDDGKISRLSLIDESGERYVRMAHLASVGSHAINGVAALHSELLIKDVLRDFYELWPHKFSNKTNGVTPRRWVVLNNQRLTELISNKIGKEWIKDLYQLKKLEPFADDAKFRKDWRACKRNVKVEMAESVKRKLGIDIDPDSMYDIQVKRIHEYKRQHLNVLHIITLY